MNATTARGLVCLDCGAEYPDVDALIASGHWQGKPCPNARATVQQVSGVCVSGNHWKCRGRIAAHAEPACRCECHERTAA